MRSILLVSWVLFSASQIFGQKYILRYDNECYQGGQQENYDQVYEKLNRQVLKKALSEVGSVVLSKNFAASKTGGVSFSADYQNESAIENHGAPGIIMIGEAEQRLVGKSIEICASFSVDVDTGAVFRYFRKIEAEQISAETISTEISQEDIWKNRTLYIGGSFGLGPIFVLGKTVLGGNLNPLQIDWQMNKFLSVGSGLNFYFAPQSSYTAPKQTDPDSGILETYNGIETHILFPLLLQFTHKFGIFSLEIGGGLYAAPIAMNTMVERTNDNGYTISEGYGKNLFTADSDNPFGVIVTSSVGVKVGRGILFLNLKYLRDFSEITVKFKDEEIGSHLWNMFGINVGYKFGLFSMK